MRHQHMDITHGALPYTVMGFGHLQSRCLQEAYKAAERGVELAPCSAFAHSSLAAIYLHMRDFDGAIASAKWNRPLNG